MQAHAQQIAMLGARCSLGLHAVHKLQSLHSTSTERRQLQLQCMWSPAATGTPAASARPSAKAGAGSPGA